MQAICGWLAWQVRRPFAATPLRRLGRAPVLLVAGLLLALAAAPIVLPLLDPQPQDVTVQDVIDDGVTEPDGWIRLRGRLVPLEERPADRSGEHGLLVDAEEALRAIVVESEEPIEEAAETMVTGHVTAAAVLVEEELPIEATVAGTPPQIVSDRLVVLDPVAKPVRSVLWPLSIPPLLLAIALMAGGLVGYPVFRPSHEVDVLAAPLAPGERVPAAYGGRIGPNESPLTDPGGVLLLVRRGPTGNVLTAQPLADDGPAPAAVAIGGAWTSGRIGYVHALNETVPALIVRSELVDATFLFARTAERDRAASLVTVER